MNELDIVAFDFKGNRILVGDSVIFMEKEYRNFMIGEVVDITELTVLLKHTMDTNGKVQTRQFHKQVIKRDLN